MKALIVAVLALVVVACVYGADRAVRNMRASLAIGIDTPRALAIIDEAIAALPEAGVAA